MRTAIDYWISTESVAWLLTDELRTFKKEESAHGAAD